MIEHRKERLQDQIKHEEYKTKNNPFLACDLAQSHLVVAIKYIHRI